MNINKKINDSGIISFFTVIFLSVLLIIMTTAFIRLMVSEQRQSTDNDLSTRAVYAAEAGIDDVMVILRDALQEDGKVTEADLNAGLGHDIEECGGGEELNPDADISYTCRFVSFDSLDITGELGAKESVDFDLAGVTNIDSVRLSWHIPSKDSSIDANVFNNQTWGIGTNRPSGQWVSNNVPGLMRLQTVRYPSAGITPSTEPGANILNNITFMYPSRTGSVPQNQTDIDNAKAATRCQSLPKSSGSFACEATFRDFQSAPYPGLGGANLFLRLQSINNKANYRLEFFDSSGDEITVPNRITIDVTGRGGDVFRRVRVVVPVTVDGDSDSLPQPTLLVDEDLCKLLEISSIATQDGCS